jgi:hypothetical protein
MSTFTCLCGHVTHAADERDGTSLVAYTVAGISATERRIAQHVSAFVMLPSEGERLAWQRAFYRSGEMAAKPLADVIEDIASYELNEAFVSMYRCPACHRVALEDPDSGRWQFFHPES